MFDPKHGNLPCGHTIELTRRENDMPPRLHVFSHEDSLTLKEKAHCQLKMFYVLL